MAVVAEVGISNGLKTEATLRSRIIMEIEAEGFCGAVEVLRRMDLHDKLPEMTSVLVEAAAVVEEAIRMEVLAVEEGDRLI